MRCALTAPFHPLPSISPKRNDIEGRSTLCCTFRRFTPPRRYLAPCPMKPGLSSPASITEISTAAIVWLTSGRILTNFLANCLRFFEQLVFYTFPSKSSWLSSMVRIERNTVDWTEKRATVVDQNAQRILYIGSDGFHKSPPP